MFRIIGTSPIDLVLPEVIATTVGPVCRVDGQDVVYCGGGPRSCVLRADLQQDDALNTLSGFAVVLSTAKKARTEHGKLIQGYTEPTFLPEGNPLTGVRALLATELFEDGGTRSRLVSINLSTLEVRPILTPAAFPSANWVSHIREGRLVKISGKDYLIFEFGEAKPGKPPVFGIGLAPVQANLVGKPGRFWDAEPDRSAHVSPFGVLNLKGQQVLFYNRCRIIDGWRTWGLAYLTITNEVKPDALQVPSDWLLPPVIKAELPKKAFAGTFGANVRLLEDTVEVMAYDFGGGPKIVTLEVL